jgi:hypothetical protein
MNFCTNAGMSSILNYQVQLKAQPFLNGKKLGLQIEILKEKDLFESRPLQVR